MAIVLTSIKHYLTLFWQCSCLHLIFQKRHFGELATKSQKHVLVKVSSTKVSYNIYNIYNRYLRNDEQSMLREMEGERERERAWFFPVCGVFYFGLNIKRTQGNSENMSIWSTLKLLRKKCDSVIFFSFFLFDFLITVINRILLYC